MIEQVYKELQLLLSFCQQVKIPENGDTFKGYIEEQSSSQLTFELAV